MQYHEMPLDPEVEQFLMEAEQRIEQFHQSHYAPGFVSCNFRQIYHALRFLNSTNAAPGNLFCEWGSGYGVASCLAAMTGWEATGIELNHSLVTAAHQLAIDFGLDVEFHCDSFIPPGSENCFDTCESTGWQTTQEGSSREDMGVSPDNFDIIFVYPWPGEEEVIESLFERHASVGSLLMTFHGREGWLLHRKVARSKRSRISRQPRCSHPNRY